MNWKLRWEQMQCKGEMKVEAEIGHHQADKVHHLDKDHQEDHHQDIKAVHHHKEVHLDKAKAHLQDILNTEAHHQVKARDQVVHQETCLAVHNQAQETYLEMQIHSKNDEQYIS